MSADTTGLIRRLRDDDSGQTLPLVAILLVVVFSMAGFALDVGYALEIRRELQASTDAAALAGAKDLPNDAQAIAAARTFSAIAGSRNERSNHPVVSLVSGYPQTKCLTSIGGSCDPVNAIVVKQQTRAPLFFANVVGWSSLTMTATATAAAKGGVPKPLDIMLVLDTTASMNNPCSATVTGVSNPTRLDCALEGARALLTGLWPCGQGISNCGISTAVDQVGLSVFPGLKQSSSISKESDCSNNMSSADIAAYNASPIYTISPLANDFRVSNTDWTQRRQFQHCQIGRLGERERLQQQLLWGRKPRRRGYLLR